MTPNRVKLRRAVTFMSALIKQFVPPTFCLYFPFTGINFAGMLHHVCDVGYDEIGLDQSELVNAGSAPAFTSSDWSKPISYVCMYRVLRIYMYEIPW